ncbi:hypothetical protein HRbin22_01375 [Candidatus Thermoflexus japonica]|uniref:Uncharacterized protein n=1 Tax=Candidatus Thermoflexus japonica TaxID=2035417 RepID=A0A2H5Y6Y5_9CHLR|nr:hypothetical protein HRbin22_01375 [Candidatus Thermoflexus japonica]
MSLLPFLALYIAIVFAPLYAAVRDLMVHQIRIERARAVLSLATRDGAQMSAPDPRGRLTGDPAAMEARVREIWAGARIPGAVLESVSCQPRPPRCEARATVTTRGLLGTLRARIRGVSTVLEGIQREGE